MTTARKPSGARDPEGPTLPWVRMHAGSLFVHQRDGSDGEARAISCTGRWPLELVLPPNPCVTTVWRDCLCSCGRFTLLVFA